MVYECQECEVQMWEEGADISTVGRNARLVCPTCGDVLVQVFGEVEDSIVAVLREYGPLSVSEISELCEHERRDVQKGLCYLRKQSKIS
jgi:hypothetical protein